MKAALHDIDYEVYVYIFKYIFSYIIN